MFSGSHGRKVAKQVDPALCHALVTVYEPQLVTSYEPQIGHAYHPSADG